MREKIHAMVPTKRTIAVVLAGSGVQLNDPLEPPVNMPLRQMQVGILWGLLPHTHQEFAEVEAKIGKILGITPRTVAIHRRGITKTLGGVYSKSLHPLEADAIFAERGYLDGEFVKQVNEVARDITALRRQRA